MRTLEEYMNDPAIAGEPEYLREIHAIRFKIQDERKAMTLREFSIAAEEEAIQIAKHYDIPLIWADLTPVIPTKRS